MNKLYVILFINIVWMLFLLTLVYTMFDSYFWGFPFWALLFPLSLLGLMIFIYMRNKINDVFSCLKN